MSTQFLDEILLSSLESLAAGSAQQPFDAVIIGGGTAGLTTARTLAEGGRRVAVLEAGPLSLLTHSTTTDLRFNRDALRSYRRRFEYSPTLAGGGTFGTLIGGVGGRGLYWSGASPRFASEDFDDWPINLQDLAPFYDWAERDIRVSRDYGSGPLGQTVARLLRRAGLPAEFCPFAIDTRATRDGWISGTLGNPVAPLLRSGLLTRQPEKNLFIAANSYATKLNLSADGSRIEGITASDRKTQTEHQVLGRSVVLAGGGFESVRLALASGVKDESGRMGKGITDHIFCRAYYPVPPELYDQHSPEAAIVRVPAETGRKYQIEIHLPGDNLFALNENSNWKPERTRDYAAMVRTFGSVRPRSDNFIEVGTAGKPGDYTVHFTYSQEDMALRDEQKSGMERVRQALGADPAEVEVRLPGQSYHEAGGLAMGTDAATSVVDTFGRFHSVPNLVVVDASSWPTQSPANPYLTITALSRRQASRLLQDLD